jgi:hypothetical protein
MATLSSILVQRGVASMRSVEDAIARQVFHGGDLATNLLEVGGAKEAELTPILAEHAGLPPAPPGPLAMPSNDVLRLVPGELALRHGVFPLALEERALVLAVAEPLPHAVEDDLGFALDLAVKQVVAPLVRIRQAIAGSYGIPLDRRFLRLVAKLDGRADPSPSAMPPPERDLLPAKMPRPVSIPSPSFGTGVPASEPEPARLGDDRPAPKTPFVAEAADFVNPAIPKSPALPQEAEVHVAEPAPEIKASVEEAVPTSAESAAKPPPGSARALAGIVRRALREERAAATIDKNRPDARPLWRPPAQRRKGPFTAAMAEHELEEAASSDAVLAIAFDFAHQYFEYAALFVVQGDLAEGREASGPGASREKVAGIGVPLDLPSSLAKVRERRGPAIVRLSAEGLDADLVRDLERGPRSPVTTGPQAAPNPAPAKPAPMRAAALLPIVVRNRVVAILYGDDGDADVELPSIGDVIALIGLAGSALERVALRKKLGARAPEIPRKVRIQDQSTTAAAALARALTTSAAEVKAKTALEPPLQGAPVVPVGDDTRGAVAMFSVEPAAPVEPAPRTARYFDEPIPNKHPTEPGMGAGIPLPEPLAEDDITHDEPARDEPAADEAPAPQHEEPPVASDADAEPAPATPGSPKTLVGIAPAPAQPSVDFDDADWETEPASAPADPAPKVTPAPSAMRRGPAPVYEGRAAAVPDTASYEWIEPAPPSAPEPRAAAPAPAPRREGAKTLPSFGFEPLPRTPPPNATAWTSFPSPPPPPSFGTLPPPRAHRDPPIPREEIDSDRTPPPRRSVNPLPSVMVDVAAEHKELIQRVIDGGQAGQEAFDELVRHGEQVVQAVMARFPGPLRVDRHRARAELPAASQCGPILELCVAIRRPALPFISVRTSSPDPEVRFWATHVLGELRYPEAATVLVPRLFDDDASVRRIARRSAAALVGAGGAGAPILKGLEDITKNHDQPVPHRVLAIETMGEIRAGSMVPPLLGALEDPVEDVADAARRALLLVTRQDFGRDVRRWHEWWMKNAARHRIEWLIDALMHEQPSVRRAAGDELKAITKEYFGYYDDLPKRERERAQGLYRAWWDREGRQRFV